MKELITKLKEIETIVELNEKKVLTTAIATDIYGITNDLMCALKKMNTYTEDALNEQKEGIRDWLNGEDFEGLAERL